MYEEYLVHISNYKAGTSKVQYMPKRKKDDER